MSGTAVSPSLAYLANAFEVEAKKYGNLIYQTLSGNVLEVTNVSEETWNGVDLPTDDSAVSFLANSVVIQSFVPSIYIGSDTYITPVVLPNAGLFMNELTILNYNEAKSKLDKYSLAKAEDIDILSQAWATVNPAYNTVKKRKVITARFVDASF
jgi:hypothetical protein